MLRALQPSHQRILVWARLRSHEFVTVITASAAEEHLLSAKADFRKHPKLSVTRN